MGNDDDNDDDDDDDDDGHHVFCCLGLLFLPCIDWLAILASIPVSSCS